MRRETGSHSRARPRAGWLLWLLLAWSLALRIWFAHVDLHHDRIYDERFNVRNAAWALHTGTLAPENGFHPSLSYLPHLGLLAPSHLIHERGGSDLFRIVEQRAGNSIGRPGPADELSFSPTGYLLARIVNCAFGAFSVFLCYLIGSRLYGPRVGLLGAFLLAAVPWHLRQSGVFKPDIVLIASSLIALYLAIVAVQRSRLSAFLLAGAGVGLAMSSKFNGIFVAVPLVAGSLAGALKDRSLLLKLLAAGVAAALLFLLLNPFVLLDRGLYQLDFGATMRGYEQRGLWAGTTSLDIFMSSFRWLLDDLSHGPWVGAAALVGLLAQGVLLLRRSGAEPDRLARLMLVSFPVGYVVLYSLSTRNPEGSHNWLILTPMTSILAAWILCRAWDLAASKLRDPLRRHAGVAATVGLVVLVSAPVQGFTHRSVVPTTTEVAADLLRRELRDLDGRVVIQEESTPPLRIGWRGRQEWAAVLIVDRISEFRKRWLTRADAEVFPRTRLRGAAAHFYESRMRRVAAGQVWEVRGRWLRTRGPDLVIVFHPWSRSGPTSTLKLDRAPGGVLVGELPAAEEDRLISIGAWLPFDGASTVANLKIGEASPGLIWVRWGRPSSTALLTSQRVRLAAGEGAAIRLDPGSKAPVPREQAALIYTWALPGAAGGDPGVTIRE